eukprot:CAMPEP_0168769392 /NCGR_PEP_ID=MMETSP0725-20121227/2378_1 /TAXON_ID=265536 /ORGANISM="Amphiprora sp., Strain CCMP467" /LENGTH=1046 /DNA_ID=CAMNT_0008818799 /DNA_START=778 /DNA_END=3918 /DNA_ORIENTATION=+
MAEEGANDIRDESRAAVDHVIGQVLMNRDDDSSSHKDEAEEMPTESSSNNNDGNDSSHGGELMNPQRKDPEAGDQRCRNNMNDNAMITTTNGNKSGSEKSEPLSRNRFSSPSTTNNNNTTPNMSIGAHHQKLLIEGHFHMARNQDILAKTAQIAKLRRETSRLKQEQKRHQRMSALKRDASVWLTLSKKDKWRKETILAVLTSFETQRHYISSELLGNGDLLPEPLTSPNFQRFAPVSLQTDEDVILAWLSRDDWTGCPLWMCMSNLPEHNWRDIAFCEMMVKKCPPMLYQIPTELFQQVNLHLNEDEETRKKMAPIRDDNMIKLFRAWLSGHQSNFKPNQRQWIQFGQSVNEAYEVSKNSYAACPDFHPARMAEISSIMLCFFNSPAIRDDAELMMEFFRANLPLTTTDMTCTLLGPKLRNSVDFAKQVAASAGSRSLPPNVLLCFTQRVCNDFSVVLSFVQANGNALEFAGPALRLHYKIVQAAARQQPSALRHARPGRALDSLSNDAKFMKQLLRQTSDSPALARMVFKCCGPKLLPRGANRRPLPKPQAPASGGQGKYSGKRPPIVSISQEEHPDAWDICLLAAHTGHESSLPYCLRNNFDFWLQAAQECRLRSLSNVPKHFRKNVRIVLECLNQHIRDVPTTPAVTRGSSDSKRRTPPSNGHVAFMEPSQIRHCFLSNPHFITQHQTQALLCLILYFKTRGCHSDEFLMEQFSKLPNHLLSDKDCMLQAIHLHAKSALQWINLDLMQDDDIVQACLQAMGPAALEYIPDETQIEHPDWVAQAIRSDTGDSADHGNDQIGNEDVDNSASNNSLLNLAALRQQREFEEPINIWSMYNWIHEELFLHREVALAWVSRGGDYLHDEFDLSLEEDAELFLLIARHNWCDFMFASESKLLSNKEFMTLAVTQNGYVLREGRRGLSTDFDLALIAFAQKVDLVDHFEWTLVESSDYAFLTDFAAHVRKRLVEHQSFIQFLIGIEKGEAGEIAFLKDHLVISCDLDLLKIGKETTNALSQHIASYIGVPTGSDLKLLRQASTNLANYGF